MMIGNTLLFGDVRCCMGGEYRKSLNDTAPDPAVLTFRFGRVCACVSASLNGLLGYDGEPHKSQQLCGKCFHHVNVSRTHAHTQGRSFQTPQHRTLAPGHLMLYYYIYKHTHTFCACIHCYGTAHNSTSLATQTRRVLITSHTRHARVCVCEPVRTERVPDKKEERKPRLFVY